MCKILLSIHPKHVEKIFSGEKVYEFRKLQSKRKPDTIVIYATSPVSKVVGEFKVKHIHKLPPEDLWSLTKLQSGITKNFFDKYYINSKFGIAYEIDVVTKFDIPRELSVFGINYPPQSFVYLD